MKEGAEPHGRTILAKPRWYNVTLPKKMSQTKKLPVGFDPKKPNRRIGHVVPMYALGLAGNRFVAVDNPKEVEIGRLVYLGRDVASADILKKVKAVHNLSMSDSELIRRLDHFLTLLEEFKIGQLVRCVNGDELRLAVVSEISAYSKPLPLP